MLWLLLTTVHAGQPAWPDCAPDRREACPSDLDDWYLHSWIPDGSRDSVRPAERALGSGVAVDVAFRTTTGRPDVAVAVIDSGIYWTDGQLTAKVLLNVDELPRPQAADGTTHDTHDADGNGVVNVWDYAEDPRVAIDAGIDATDRLDPSDLIHTFSDGVDDDGNGYVDDIAGWDFFDGDNDPYAALRRAGASDHGTGVMKKAVAADDDGGDLGVCPGCSVLPLRIGDAFIGNGDRIALALAYAADRGAGAAAMAIGGLSHPSWAREVVRHADRAGVVLVGAAGDENSWHHNFPAVDDPVLYVHSVRGDNQQEDDGTYSYFNIWNCNNWGPRVDLVAPSDLCATGATAAIAGAAALVVSAGRDAGMALTAAEVRALLLATADDVALSPAEQDRARAYPSEPGFDLFFGHGRVNVGRAVDQLAAGALPPVATLDAPSWFSWHTPGDDVAVHGSASSRTSRVSRWELAWGLGPDPDDWTVAAEGADAHEGLLTTLSLPDPNAPSPGDLTADTTIEDRLWRAHEPMVTLRLTVVDTDGRATEARRGVWVHRDPSALPGWPMAPGSSVEAAPILVDLDADGVLEVVIAASDGVLHVVRGSGEPVAGFPVTTGPLPLEGYLDAPAFASGAVPAPHEGIIAGPAAGDLDGDGIPELVVATLWGSVWAWRADGSVVDGFPVTIDGRGIEELTRDRAWENTIMATPALGDVDGDGDLDIVIGGGDQRLYVWDEAARLLPGYPLVLCLPGTCDEGGARIVSSPALGDIDGDGDLDAAIATNEVPVGDAGVLYLVDLATATVFPGWPRSRPGLINETILPVIGEGHPSSVSLADLDGDGDLELWSNAVLGTEGPMHHDGTPALDLAFTADAAGDRSNFDGGAVLALITNPAFGDLDGDGVLDPVLGGAGVDWLVSLALATRLDFQHAVGAWSGATGEALPGFPHQIDDISFLVSPAIADVSGDGRPEVLYASGGHFLHAWDADGTPAPGFPLFTGGWSISGPAVGDIDGDGFLDVVLATREGTVHAWSTAGRADQAVQWASNRHDAHNSGNSHVALPVQAGPPDADVSEPGGCCRRSSRPQSTAALFLPVLVALRRRRSTPSSRGPHV